MSATVISAYEGSYDDHIRRAAEQLRAGGVVVIPMETVYGAAAALNQATALERLRQISATAQASRHAFIPHLAQPKQAFQFLDELTDFGKRCIRKLWPGPVSLVFRVSEARRKAVADSLHLAEADLYDGDSITLRCPDHPIAADVIGRAGAPVAAVKAGSDVADDGRQIAAALADKVDLVIDAGPPRFSKPSTVVRVNDDSYEILRTGIYDQRIIERLLRTTILFVCSGNTCRSPMAEAITRHLLAQKMNIAEEELEKKGLAVLSAGAMAMPGSRAAPAAVDVVREMGGDLSRHRSRMLSVELIHQADMIFAMSKNHARAVTALVPSASEKVATLNPQGDIEDPIGGDAALYQQVAGELRSLIEKRLNEKVLL